MPRLTSQRKRHAHWWYGLSVSDGYENTDLPESKTQFVNFLDLLRYCAMMPWGYGVIAHVTLCSENYDYRYLERKRRRWENHPCHQLGTGFSARRQNRSLSRFRSTGEPPRLVSRCG